MVTKRIDNTGNDWFVISTINMSYNDLTLNNLLSAHNITVIQNEKKILTKNNFCID
jgi:hypothetical protein